MDVKVTLTKEETNKIENFLNDIGKFDCSAIYCWACPFNITTQEHYGQTCNEHHDCIIKERLPRILRDYGYKGKQISKNNINTQILDF